MSSLSHQPRAKSPLRVKSLASNEAESVSTFSEAKLVQAIQTLDATWKSKKTKLESCSTSQEETSTFHLAPSPLSDSLRKSLCYLLEIAACFDTADVVNKSKLETVCTARVLGCLKRFVTGMEPPLGACCERRCEQRLVHLTLLSFLFRMCREPEVVSNVVKENLHSFLIKMCIESEVQNPADTNANEDLSTQEEEVFDPHDLMITVDPFDWCYESLCTRLLKENTHAFFIPMGIRSLICVLRGTELPTDEVSELEQQIHASSGIREKSPKRRKLPSIFAFPLNDSGDEGTKEGPKTFQYKLAPLCCEDISTQREQRQTRALWSLILSDSSRIHLALRSLIALVIHIPRPSLEYRSLLRERDYIRRVFWAYKRLTPNHHNLEDTLSRINSSNTETLHVELLPFQLIAIQASILKRIACSALPLFAEEQNVAVMPQQQLSTGGRRTLSPIRKTRDFTDTSKKRRDCESQSIQQRLNAASEAAHSELINERIFLCRGSELEQNRQRLAIRKMCVDVERLRNHLVRSLEVLRSGRQHPDPQQSFSEWIKSLPTLETLERERQYQQEMRERHILELQYQREAQRRRERDEWGLMQSNDYNMPEENEISRQQHKHEQFLRMQVEMLQLEQRDSDDDSSKARAETNAPTKKEKLAIQERQRLLQLEGQRRERRELEKMSREDLYYVEYILKAKAKVKEEQEKREKSGVLQNNAIEEQQKHIARMRLLDEEKRLAERETSGMRVEDLLGRQMRFREAEKAKQELHDEWRERKTMQAEEHECRSHWTLWDRALMQQQQEELKQQRAEARRLKRQQQREEKEIRAAWIESWDENDNKYYYNSITCISQWEAPM